MEISWIFVSPKKWEPWWFHLFVKSHFVNSRAHEVFQPRHIFMVTFYMQGVFNVNPEKGLHLVEIADGVSVQDVVEATEAEFTVSKLFIEEIY